MLVSTLIYLISLGSLILSTQLSPQAQLVSLIASPMFSLFYMAWRHPKLKASTLGINFMLLFGMECLASNLGLYHFGLVPYSQFVWPTAFIASFWFLHAVYLEVSALSFLWSPLLALTYLLCFTLFEKMDIAFYRHDELASYSIFLTLWSAAFYLVLRKKKDRFF